MIGRISRLNDTGSSAAAAGQESAAARIATAIGARAGLTERFAIGTTPLENARVAVGPGGARRGPASPAGRSADSQSQYIVRIAGEDQLGKRRLPEYGQPRSSSTGNGRLGVAPTVEPAYLTSEAMDGAAQANPSEWRPGGPERTSGETVRGNREPAPTRHAAKVRRRDMESPKPAQCYFFGAMSSTIFPSGSRTQVKKRPLAIVSGIAMGLLASGLTPIFARRARAAFVSSTTIVR